MRTLTIFALAVCMAEMATPSQAQSRTTLSPQDVKQINELTQAFAKGVLAKEQP
jgi:hypothetical protein